MTLPDWTPVRTLTHSFCDAVYKLWNLQKNIGLNATLFYTIQEEVLKIKQQIISYFYP
jgi:hypothetical protein